MSRSPRRSMPRISAEDDARCAWQRRVPSRRPLTSREQSPYDQVIPIDDSRVLVYRSEFDVTRSVPTHFCRGGVLALSAALCLLSGLKPVRGAGCHVADGPILQSRFSWERDQSLDRKALLVVHAPLILTHSSLSGAMLLHLPPPSSSVTSPAVYLPSGAFARRAAGSRGRFSPYCRIISIISRLRFDLIVPHDRSNSVQ